ncbi:MAG TPA: branched-chain amino acid aminotransferase [Anseongella sp.]|nr:branched-chain amino acid aminotransferase [Anseongella sp.]
MAEVRETNIRVEQTLRSRLPEVDVKNLSFGKVFTDHMFQADYAGESWTDLQILPYGPVEFDPAIMSLHYGQTIFEGMKAFRTVKDEVVLFRPHANLERLNVSAERMCMPRTTEEVFMDGLMRLVDMDRAWIPSLNGYSLYIRPYMYATDQFLGVRPSENYRFSIICSPAGAYYSKPLRVKIETHYTRSARGGIGFAKAGGNYGLSLLPTKMAQQEGFDQIIWTDALRHEFIEEAGTANLMFVLRGALITPPVKDTILRGITRDSVLTLARSWGLDVQEREISVHEIVEAMESGSLAEAFAVGTAATVTHISEIGYQGKVYTLPDVTRREISPRILQTLNDIRYGKAEDQFGWLVKV